MESSFRCAGRQSIKPSEVIDVTKFTVDFNSCLDANIDFLSDNQEEKKKCVKLAMDICDETYDELETVCSISTLIDENDSQLDDKEFLYLNFPDDVNLACVKMQKVDVDKRLKHHDYKRARLRRMKYKCRDEQLLKENTGEVDIPLKWRVPPGTAVLTVRVYEPFCPSSKWSKKPTMHTDHIYQVLGTQCLTELRDKIRCVSDLMVEGDFSQNPDLPSDLCAWDIYKSAFFFIEGKFYNDFRDPDCRDYSKVIMDWASSKHRGMGPYESASMGTVKFEELSISLGQPYLYMHQGNCEHLIVFSDLRMHHPNDIQDLREYPLMLRRRLRKRTMCVVCRHTACRWVTKNDDLAPENPCYFCDGCFRSLHYDEEGKKVCQFEAYKYFDSHVVL